MPRKRVSSKTLGIILHRVTKAHLNSTNLYEKRPNLIFYKGRPKFILYKEWPRHLENIF